jgi:PncC family amidohydrolase
MIYNANDIKKIRDFMLAHNHNIAVAESVTSGHIQAALSTADEASLFFQGGITAYNINQKYSQLHIDPAHCISCNCVSRKVAEEMAVHVCKQFNADWGIGVTGYASPLSHEPGMQLYALYSIAFKGHKIKTEAIIAVPGTAFEVQVGYANTVLKNCVGVLEDVIL